MEENLLCVWYNGRFSDGDSMWGAHEISFMQGDDALEDPFSMRDTAGYGNTPLAAVLECLKNRPKKKRK